MLDTILKFVTLGTVVVSCLAVYTAVRNNGRQLGVQIFLNYSERVQALKHALSRDDTRERALHDLLYVILEFYTLRRKGYVATDIWEIWQADIARFLTSEHVEERWSTIEIAFSAHAEFMDWIRRRRT